MKPNLFERMAEWMFPARKRKRLAEEAELAAFVERLFRAKISTGKIDAGGPIVCEPIIAEFNLPSSPAD